MTIDIKELRKVIADCYWPTSPVAINEILDRLEAAESAISNLGVTPEESKRGLARHKEILARIEAAEKAWKISDQTVYDLTEKVIPNIQEKLESAEKERDAAELMSLALRANIEQMEQQTSEPAARTVGKLGEWVSNGDGTYNLGGCLDAFVPLPDGTLLYALPCAKPTPNAVAYLDLGVGGYMDIGTDLTDEELATLPKGRHMLGIVGTYGVEGYSPAQPAPSVPDDVIERGLKELDAIRQNSDRDDWQPNDENLVRRLYHAMVAYGMQQAQPAPSVPELIESLRCACNYIDKLGGVSQQYRAMIAAAPEAKP